LAEPEREASLQEAPASFFTGCNGANQDADIRSESWW
jgi:hypothetical protein